MKLSVVMTTYNGMKYLEEQLDSIRNQTRDPDEVLIIDDASTDETCEYIDKYIKEYGLYTWALHRNKKNAGWKAMFHFGIEKTSGDIVFLCDQDDVWDLSKLEKMSRIFEQEKDVAVLACSYEPFYMDRDTPRISTKILKTMKDDNSIRKVKLDGKYLYVMRPGCTYGFRKDFFESIKEYWSDNVAHDAILWRTAVLLEKMYLYDKKLVRWRRFTDSASSNKSTAGSEKNDLKAYELTQIINDEADISFLEKLLTGCFWRNNSNCERYVKKGYEFKKRRLFAYKSGSIVEAIRCILTFPEFYLSSTNALRDIQLITLK